MKNFLLFICIILSNSIYSQESSIATKFSEDGTLYDSLSASSTSLSQFKKNEDCIVISYLGKDIYKVKYKEWVGVLNSDFLLINEEMMDLYYDFQEKERIKVIEERENRKKRLQEIIRNS
ncbi:hypothetical protein, partial [uncultured Wocania sp.]|uniref:hypothetical protein n=1 Tax=uncultured Wocania sp. TaxID=2834404 RepID=UPI0030F5E663